MPYIFGPNVLGSVQPYLPYLVRLQPRVSLLMDPKGEDVLALHNVCPNTKIVGRIYVPDSEVQGRILADPLDAAVWTDSLITGHAAFQTPVNFWHVANEVCQYWDQIPALNLYSIYLMKLANAHNYHVGIGVNSVGQFHLPEDYPMAFWEHMYPSMMQAKREGHAYLIHQYGWPTLWGPEEKGGADWLIHRFEHQVYPRLPFSPPQFICSEFGLDGLIMGGNPAGWSTVMEASAYANDLHNIGMYLEQYTVDNGGPMLGYCLYCLGSNGDPQWSSYNVEPVLPYLIDLQQIPENPEDGDPNMDQIEVFDLDGNPHDEAWLADNWEGCKVLREEVPEGEEVFRIIAVYITSGNATMKGEVRDHNGFPRKGQFVCMTYHELDNPDPSLTDLRGSGAKSLWSNRGVLIETNADGLSGFGLGPNYGPLYHVFIVSPGAYSDCLTMTGMKGGTNHHGPLHVVFKLTTQHNNLSFEETLELEAERHDVLPIYEESGFVKVAKSMGIWPTSDEFRFDYDGVRYAARRFRDPNSTQIVALFCVDGQYDTITPHVYYHKKDAPTRFVAGGFRDGGLDIPPEKVYK